jgi:hypothetical protein
MMKREKRIKNGFRERKSDLLRGWSVRQGFTPYTPIALELGAHQPDR